MQELKDTQRRESNSNYLTAISARDGTADNRHPADDGHDRHDGHTADRRDEPFNEHDERGKLEKLGKREEENERPKGQGGRGERRCAIRKAQMRREGGA